jgi:hypothetical protein
MAHRTLYAVMGPLDQFSVLPYLIDPPQHTDVRASKWHLNHQQAHDDFILAVPAGYENPAIGIPTSQILVDSDLSNPESRTWWTFANHQEHYIAEGTVLPLPNPTTQAGLPASSPWWIPAPRWTLPPYW